MASEIVDVGRPSPESVGLARAVERAIRDSRSLDVESLCIEAGERVWEVECQVVVTSLGGNALDASILASIASLRHFRRPEVSLSGDGATVKGYSEGVPTPLSVHHTPIAVSFALIRVPPRAPTGAESEDAPGKPVPFSMETTPSGIVTQSSVHSGATGLVAVLDPTDREEVVASGRITFCFTAGGREMCFLDKPGGAPLPSELFDACMGAAQTHARVVSRGLDGALRQAELRYKQEDMRRHAYSHGYGGARGASGALSGGGRGGSSAAPLLDRVSRVLDVFAPSDAGAASRESGGNSATDGAEAGGDPAGPSLPGNGLGEAAGSFAAAVAQAEAAHSGMLGRAGVYFYASAVAAGSVRRSRSVSGAVEGAGGHAQADGIEVGKGGVARDAVGGGGAGRKQKMEARGGDPEDELFGLTGGAASGDGEGSIADLASMAT